MTLWKSLSMDKSCLSQIPPVVNRFPKKRSTGYITMDAADNIKEVKAQFEFVQHDHPTHLR